MILHLLEAEAQYRAGVVRQTQESDNDGQDHQGHKDDGQPEPLVTPRLLDPPLMIAIGITDSLDCRQHHEHLARPRVFPEICCVLIDVEPPCSPHAKLPAQLATPTHTSIRQRLRRLCVRGLCLLIRDVAITILILVIIICKIENKSKSKNQEQEQQQNQAREQEQ